MIITNRAQLLQFAKKQLAFEDNTLEALISHVKECGVDVLDANGNNVLTEDNIKKLWAKDAIKKLGAKKVTVSVSADNGEEVELENDSPAVEQAEDAPVQTMAKSKTLNASKAMGFPSIGDSRKKNYDRKANEGKTCFSCADAAEAFTAAWRLKAASFEGYNYSQKARDLEIVGKDGTELVNSLGGALIADSFQNRLVYLTEAYGVARAVSNVVDMTGGDTIFPRKTGIVTMTHVSQGNTFTSADNSYDNITLVPKQVGVIIKTNAQLFRNAAIDVADDIAKTIDEAQRVREDNDFFLGDGTSTYGGHVGLASAFNGTNLPTAASLTGVANSWSGQTAAYLISALGAVANVNPSRLAWYMSRQAFANIAIRLANAQGGQSGKDFLGANYIGVNGGTLLGFPVRFVQVMPTTSASGQIFAYFGDLEGATMLGYRAKLEVTRSTEAGFAANQIWTRASSEIAVAIHGDGKSSGNGPIVALKTT